MKDFTGRVAVITGAASGIGRALAIQLAERGCSVALADKDVVSLELALNEVAALGSPCSMHELDVSNQADFAALAVTVNESYGKVNILINNAGVTLVDTVEGQSDEDFQWLMNINFWGVVYGTKSFLPYLKAADEAHIVNVSSLFGLLAMPMQSAYNASKFAVRGFTEALAIELTGSNVSVSCVHPGGIKTAIAKNARVSFDGFETSKDETSNDKTTKDAISSNFEGQAKTTPEQAAAKIIRGIEKKQRRVLIGLDAWLMDKVVRLFPARYAQLFRLHKVFDEMS